MPDFNLGVARGAIDINTASLTKASAQTAAFAKTTKSSLAATSASMAKVGTSMTKFVTLPIVGALALSVKSLLRIEQINAQTTQVIKSTEGAANVTAKSVEDLAGRIEDTTSVEAESVQQGANLLLTFKNIRNEAGQGNDIFDQSVKALTDMSVAMGQDVSAGAIKFGKALNDPLKGLTALTKVGVIFTDDQKEMIKTLVENGDTMQAQKIILGELTSEFGGSGKALAETTQGQLKLAGHALGTAGEAIAQQLLPALRSLAIGIRGVALGLAGLPAPARTAVLGFALLFAAIGPLLKLGAKLIENWNSISGVAKLMFRSVGNATLAMKGMTAQQIVAGGGASKLSAAYGTAALGAIGLGVAAGVAAREGIIALTGAMERNANEAQTMGRQLVITGELMHQNSRDFADAAAAADAAANDPGFAAFAETAGHVVTTATGSFEELEKEVLSGKLTVQDAAGGFTTLFEQTGRGAANTGVELQKLSEQMFHSGTITRDELIDNLRVAGLSYKDATNRATILDNELNHQGHVLSVTGEKIHHFANLTAKEFGEWRDTTVANLKAASPALEKLAEKAKVSARSVIRSFRAQSRQLQNYSGDLKKFTKLNLPDELKQQIIDMGLDGAAVMDRFTHLSGKQLRAVSKSFEDGQHAIEDTQQPLNSLNGDVDTSADHVQGLTDDMTFLKSQFSNLQLHVHTTFTRTGTPPDGSDTGTGGNHDGGNDGGSDSGGHRHPRTVTTDRIADTMDGTVRTTTTTRSTATSSGSGTLTGIAIVGTLDITDDSQAVLRGIVVEEIEDDAVFQRSRGRVNR